MSLTEQIHAIEQRFGEATIRCGTPDRQEQRPTLPTGWSAIDTALGGGGLSMAALHEWFGVAPCSSQDAGRNHETRPHPWTPPLGLIVHLVRRAMDIGSYGGWVVWVGRCCFPYGGVLVGANGHLPLLDRSIFVTANRPDDRLWAVDLALRCPVVNMVVADGSGFDMAATRRIQLVAKSHHTPALVVRPPWEASQLSAAQTRWLVRWDASGKPVDDESILLNPRWNVALLRCKGISPDSSPREWALEWDRGQGVVRLSTAVAHSAGDAGAATSHRRLRQA